MAFGFHAVRTALTHSPRRVERLLLSRGAEDGRVRHLVALAREAGVPFQEVPREALDRLSDSVRHQGVAARLAGTDLLPAEELLDALPDDAVVVVLDGIEDPRNIGAILRSAAAFGAAGVFLPIHHSAGLSPAAIKTAAGAIDLVPVARAGNVSRLLEELADRGLTAVALDPESGVPPWEAPLTGPIALVAGGEEKGIRPTVAERCPVRVRIPIRDEVGSLNVSVAVGIVLAETRRQRDKPLPILDDGEGGW
jgi:23S rRNA (guanosine2251-2'-O)-methyltransferase